MNGDVEADLRRNYADDVTVVSNWAWRTGTTGVRGMADLLRAQLSDCTFTYRLRLVDNGIGLLQWTAESTADTSGRGSAGGVYVSMPLGVSGAGGAAAVLIASGVDRRSLDLPVDWKSYSACDVGGSSEEAAVASKTFTVEEIHCGACETAIRKALGRVDGVRLVDPDAATNQVTVVFDESALDEAAVAERLGAAGYPVVG